MFVNEFFFSFFLLAFTGILMVGGIVLLVDALRRLSLDIFESTRQMKPQSIKTVPKKSDERMPTLEKAA